MTNRIRLAAMTLMLSLAAGPARAATVLVDHGDNVLAPDGWYALAYPSLYLSSAFNGSDGKKAADVDLVTDLVLLRAITYQHLGKLPFAFQVILPVGQVNETKLFDEKSSGIGDLIFGPGAFLYANEKSATYLSVWLYGYAPTGAWDASQTVNFGAHHWYFEEQLSFNKTFASKFCFDLNVNFYQHTEEPDTNVTPPPRFELAAIVGYQLNPKLILGLNGGAYWDLSDSKVAGVKAADTAASATAFGPSAAYQATDKLGLTFRWTHDFSATNDFQGDAFWLRGTYAF
jgi:hypothetical protein